MFFFGEFVFEGGGEELGEDLRGERGGRGKGEGSDWMEKGRELEGEGEGGYQRRRNLDNQGDSKFEEWNGDHDEEGDLGEEDE